MACTYMYRSITAKGWPSEQVSILRMITE